MSLKRKMNQLYFPLLFALTAVILFSGCKKDDKYEPKIVLGNEGSIDVPSKGGAQRIVLVSNMAWNAKADADWIQISNPEGEKGKITLEFTVSENTEDARSGMITIATVAGTVTKEIAILQESGLTDNFFVKEGASGTGKSWGDAAALEDALANAVSGSVIYIAEGTYIPSVTVTGGNESDEGDKTFEINKNIPLRGGYPANASGEVQADPEKYKTVLSGNGKSYHVVTVSAAKVPDQKVVLEGLTVTNGNASASATSASIAGTDFRRDYGGGMIIGNAEVEIIQCDIIKNKSDKFVAGLFIFGGGEVVIKNSRINQNVSKGNGAGLWANASVVHLHQSEVNENQTPGTAAGIHGYPDASIYIYGSTVANNKGNSYGAGVYLRQKSKGYIVNSVIHGNESGSKNGGGGIMLYDNCEMNLISSTITGNKIAGPGGGVFRRQNTNKLNVYNSIISGNTQAATSEDIAAHEADAVAPVLQAVVAGTKVYSAAGSEVADVSFSPGSMLNDRFVPVGDNNPALTMGMKASELKTIASTLNWAEDEEVAVDKNGNSRTDAAVMGPYIK